eukprot:TRINITY_DN10838_c0_g1_i1.p1 TRINITY_DN10838_c0_g1~~TRINITY_DN10838_c0_g1_i1.p1  ORF type:complete len:345 (-),score=101.21 TRINITY_DN10838_c0_g1_i1:209-1243(-)
MQNVDEANVKTAQDDVPTEEKQDENKDDGQADQSEEPQMVTPEVTDALKSELLEMGFGEHRVVRALYFSGNSTVEGAINWLMEHEGDEDLDTPLLISKESQKKVLSEEERAEKAKELLERARKKREAEEARLEAEREKERIRVGKELLLAKKKEDDLKFKRLAEERRLEKLDEERAKERVREKLEEDRKARRRKLGLPEELTEDEKKEEEERKRKEAEEKNKSKLPVKPISKITHLRDILVEVKKENPEPVFKTACKTLMAYCGNVYNNPDEETKRKIRISNKAFQERIVVAKGAISFLETVGFVEDATKEFYVLSKEDVSMELLKAAGAELDGAMNNPFFGAL